MVLCGWCTPHFTLRHSQLGIAPGLPTSSYSTCLSQFTLAAGGQFIWYLASVLKHFLVLIGWLCILCWQHRYAGVGQLRLSALGKSLSSPRVRTTFAIIKEGTHPILPVFTLQYDPVRYRVSFLLMFNLPATGKNGFFHDCSCEAPKVAFTACGIVEVTTQILVG